MKRILLIFSFCFFSFFSVVKAQTGANLVLGLDELVYSKGNLDTELISQIIAGKQKELKTEFMKRFVLRNFNQGSFAFSNFMASSLDLLLNEKNKKVVTREIMEHATNLALVYGFAEMYLQAEWRKPKFEMVFEKEKKITLGKGILKISGPVTGKITVTLDGEEVGKFDDKHKLCLKILNSNEENNISINNQYKKKIKEKAILFIKPDSNALFYKINSKYSTLADGDSIQISCDVANLKYYAENKTIQPEYKKVKLEPLKDMAVTKVSLISKDTTEVYLIDKSDKIVAHNKGKLTTIYPGKTEYTIAVGDSLGLLKSDKIHKIQLNNIYKLTLEKKDAKVLISPKQKELEEFSKKDTLVYENGSKIDTLYAPHLFKFQSKSFTLKINNNANLILRKSYKADKSHNLNNAGSIKIESASENEIKILWGSDSLKFNKYDKLTLIDNNDKESTLYSFEENDNLPIEIKFKNGDFKSFKNTKYGSMNEKYLDKDTIFCINSSKKAIIKKAIIKNNNGHLVITNHGSILQKESPLKISVKDSTSKVIFKLYKGTLEKSFQTSESSNFDKILSLLSSQNPASHYISPEIIDTWQYRQKETKTSIKSLLDNLKSKIVSISKCKLQTHDDESFNQILIDLVYDACRESEVVKSHGFFKQEENLDQKAYEYQSLYYRYKDSTDFILNGEHLLDSLHAEIKHKIETIFTYYGLIKRLQKEVQVKNLGGDNNKNSDGQCVLKKYKEKKTEMLTMLASEQQKGKKVESFQNPKLKNSKEALGILNEMIVLADNCKKLEKEVIKYGFEYQLDYKLDSINQDDNKTSDLVNTDKRQKEPKQDEFNTKNNESKLNFLRDDKINILTKKYFLCVFEYNQKVEEYKKKRSNSDISSINKMADSILINGLSKFKIDVPKHNKFHKFDKDGIFKEINPKKLKEEKEILEKEIENIISDAKSSQQNKITETIENNFLSEIIEELKKNLEELQLDSAKTLSVEELEIIKKLYAKIMEIENFQEAAINYAFIDSLESKILPNLLALNIKYGNFKEIINSLNNLKDAGFYLLVEKFVSNDELKNFIHLGDQMVNFIAKIDELNEAQTYSHILDLIVDAGFIYENTAAGQVINTVVNGLNKYTEIDEKANTLTLDLESLVLKMYKMYAEKNQSSKVEVYFSVGMNQSFVIGDKSPYLFNSEQSQNNISFVGEKLGVKVKLFNFGKHRLDIYGNQIGYTSNKGYLKGIKDLSEKEELKRQKTGKPLVSDIYWFTYGSGLLYNLVNLSTESNFKGALFGTGLGVSFFNGLDINFSAAVSSEKFFYTHNNNTPIFLNLGFDIKIFEYLEALSEKQKLKKQEKLKADVLSIEDNSK